MTTVTLAGKEYPMSFSLMAAKKIAKEHESIQKFFDGIDTEDVTENAIEKIIYVIDILINQGCAYKNYFEKDVPPPKDAPVIDGKWTPMPSEVLGLAITFENIGELYDKISECMGKDTKRKVETVGGEGKEKASQE